MPRLRHTAAVEDTTRRAAAAWRVPVRIEDVPIGGQRFDLAADEPTRAALARAAGLLALPRLAATFDVAHRGRDGLRVTGTVAATVSQACVVTLDPVDSAIEETVDLTFVPTPGEIDVRGEVSVDAMPTIQDQPESLVNGTVDLGAIATEFLMLGIDPYPRRAGAVFAPPASGEASSSPFAALAAIKKRDE
jgi:hypothetical protein